MSDKKKGSNDSSSASTKAPSKAGGFCKRLEEFFKTARALEKDTDGLAGCGALVDEHAAVKDELIAKQQEIEVLRRQKQGDTAKIKDLTARKAVLVEEFQSALQEHEARQKDTKSLEDKILHLRRDLQESKQAFDVLSGDYTRLQDECNRQAARLREEKMLKAKEEASQAKIRHLETQTAKDELRHVDVKEQRKKLENLAAKCHALVVDQFHPRGEARFSLSIMQQETPRIPLAPPISVSARLMWCATVEAIIGKALTEHIFVDFYHPEDAGVREAMSKVLDALSPARQRMVRCQFLADNPWNEDDDGMETEVTVEAAEAALTEVSTKLVPLLSDQPVGDGLLDKLLELFLQAAAIWSRIQRAPWRAVASMSPDTVTLDGSLPTGRHNEYGDFATTTNDKSAPHPDVSATATPLFPRIEFRGEETQGTLFWGVALWPHQTVVIQARQEVEAFNNGRDMRNGDLRLSSGAKRRMSIAPGSSPASPTYSSASLKSPKAHRPPPTSNGPQGKAGGKAAASK